MDNVGSTGMLLSAAKLGNRDVVRDLLGAANVVVNAKDSHGMTARKGHIAIVKDLLGAVL